MKETNTNSTAFLVLLLGGVGNAAATWIRSFYERENFPFHLFMGQMDTDPTRCDASDDSFFMPLTKERLDAIQANPDSFGPVAEAFVEHYSEFLDPEDAQNGSRTLRPLSQLAWEAYREKIIECLAAWIRQLRRRGSFSHIQPIFVSSSGGGCGSALQLLLSKSLTEPLFLRRVLEGFPDKLLHRPIVVVGEPFAQAIKSRDCDANNILGNAFAFRIESALLERRGAFKYVFHVGMANEGGAVLDTIEEIAKVLGVAVYGFMRDWRAIKARFVDGPDRTVLRGKYSGLRDLPETILPPDQLPSYASTGNGNGRGTTPSPTPARRKRFER